MVIFLTFHTSTRGQQICADTSKITSCKVNIPNRRFGLIQKSKLVGVSSVKKQNFKGATLKISKSQF